MIDIIPGQAESRYQALTAKRDVYLARARKMATMTLPSVFPPDGIDGADLVDPYQSIGSRGVNNLASKLLLALLPPGMPFFRYMLDPVVEQKLTDLQSKMQAGDVDPKDEMEKALAQYETAVLNEVERSQLRPAQFVVLKHLIIGGNCLLHVPNKGTVRYFPLNSYVVKRDPRGSVLEIYTHEKVSPLALPVSMQAFAISTLEDKDASPDDEVDLYTGCKLNGNQWQMWQEVGGRIIPGSVGSSPLEDPQYLPLRFSRIDGEDYGRGYVEEYAGDLTTAEALSQAISEGSLAASKVVWMVRPNSTTNPRDLQEAKNNSFVEGNPEDVVPLQMNKSADFAVALKTIQDVRAALGFAFLLNTSVQRQAERVTAEEVRFVAQELEDALGGVYSLLAEEFQRPLVQRLTARLAKAGTSFQKLPVELARPVLVTGLDALGRGHELARLERALNTITQLLGPTAVADYMKTQAIISKVMLGNGLNASDTIKSDAELQAHRQQQASLQMAQSASPAMATQIGQMLQNQQLQQAQQTNGAPPNG